MILRTNHALKVENPYITQNKKIIKVKRKELTIKLSMKTFARFIILQEKRNISI